MKDNIQFKGYFNFLNDVKHRIKTAQIKANLAVNKELILLYWEIGKMVTSAQNFAGWGKKIIPILSKDLKNEFPELKGFSERNISSMKTFYTEYSFLHQAGAKIKGKKNDIISHQVGAKLSKLCLQIPWRHNVLLIEKIKNINERLWYLQSIIEHGWSRNILAIQIANNAFKRQGKAITNFKKALPPLESDLAIQTLKDPYIFDFLTLDTDFRERELEISLIKHLQEFLIELGKGFAFVGRQYKIAINNEEFYIDLLFYHLKLRCYIVIDLKKGSFKPEYAGKLNFYLNAVDDQIKHYDDKSSIGLILCQDKKQIVAEYSLLGIKKAIGVSEYRLTKALPKEFKSSLPTIGELEKELKKNLKNK